MLILRGWVLAFFVKEALFTGTKMVLRNSLQLVAAFTFLLSMLPCSTSFCEAGDGWEPLTIGSGTFPASITNRPGNVSPAWSPADQVPPL